MGRNDEHSWLEVGAEVVGKRRARKVYPTRATAKPGASGFPSQSRAACHTLRNFSTTSPRQSHPPLEQVIAKSQKSPEDVSFGV